MKAITPSARLCVAAVVTSRHARGLDPVLSIVSVNIKSEIICARRRRQHVRTLLSRL